MKTLRLELPSQESLTQSNLVRWSELVLDPILANLNQRIETDRYGHIVMSPPRSARHGSYQFRIGVLLNQLKGDGRVITECPISTADGVKVADVAWASSLQIEALGDHACFLNAPEICVEIISSTDTEREIQEKTALCFDAGAREVWHCTVGGRLMFWLAEIKHPSAASQICPRFPAQISF